MALETDEGTESTVFPRPKFGGFRGLGFRDLGVWEIRGLQVWDRVRVRGLNGGLGFRIIDRVRGLGVWGFGDYGLGFEV